MNIEVEEVARSGSASNINVQSLENCRSTMITLILEEYLSSGIVGSSLERTRRSR